jgi:2,4-dienoyl-CoA reductase-like NADH-dependent reductase (Old Yellow Enzyme family)
LTVPVQRNLGSIVGTSQTETRLFEPLQLRSLTLRNRIMVAPMCRYSCVDGYATDWHLVHLGSRAVGGASLVMAEASAVEARGRISPHDAGIWEDGHVGAWAGVARFIASQGAVPAIQLAHAGRKASVHRPWQGGAPLRPDEGAWPTVSASAIPFADGWHVPHALTLEEIGGIVRSFEAAARRNVATARIPMAPGYQVPYAERVRRETGVLSGAVGLITAPELAEEIVANGRADTVLLARELLRDPYWPLHAARALGADIDYWPAQYTRARH